MKNQGYRLCLSLCVKDMIEWHDGCYQCDSRIDPSIRSTRDGMKNDADMVRCVITKMLSGIENDLAHFLNEYIK